MPGISFFVDDIAAGGQFLEGQVDRFSELDKVAPRPACRNGQ
jgi:hypothetical protein